MIFISGFFHLPTQTTQVGYNSEIGSYALVLAPGPTDHFFAGYLEVDPGQALGGLSGFTRDKFGDAHLSEVHFEGSKLTFAKEYNGRKDVINYTFTRDYSDNIDGIWIGNYQGVGVLSGSAWCVLTTVDAYPL